MRTLFTANRSYQEKINDYKSIENYFENFVKDADIVVVSSHSHGSSITDIQQMFGQLTAKAYNVAGVFWSNDFGVDAIKISSQVPWQERLWIENPVLTDADSIKLQIRARAFEFAEILVERARFQ